MPTDTYTEWIEREQQRDGATHWDGCYKVYPACAALAERARILNLIESLPAGMLDVSRHGFIDKGTLLAAIRGTHQ